MTSSPPRGAKRPKLAQNAGVNNHDPERESFIVFRAEDYTVAWICALDIEMGAALAMLDSIHPDLPMDPNDSNSYILGNIGKHNVVIACLPSGQYGTINAAVVGTNLHRSFKSIRICLMVGIGGGVPGKEDIRLGDIVVGHRVTQGDLGKIIQGGEIQRRGLQKTPRPELSTAVTKLRAMHRAKSSDIPLLIQDMLENNPIMTEYAHPGLSQDLLFGKEYVHVESEPNCDKCDRSQLVQRTARPNQNPVIYYGGIASGNQVIKDSSSRDKIAEELDIICFEMEGAGLDALGCLVIRGISDYSDSHKAKRWQGYSAAAAAAYAKELLLKGLQPFRVASSAVTRVNWSDPEDNAHRKQIEENRKTLLQSLRFNEMGARWSNIKYSQDDTCNWILDDEKYLSWRSSEGLVEHGGFLWIKGKPGAGKSTLMKFIHSAIKKEYETDSAAETAPFSFNARGEYLERSVTGMHRSLLFRLLKSFDDLQEVFDDPDLPLINHPNESMGVDVLRELFRNAILKLGKRRFTCIIDALDECDEQQIQDIVIYFEELAMKTKEEGIEFRVCFSSRHYPHIFIQCCLSLTLEEQPGHHKALEKYMTNRLATMHSPLIEKLQKEILRKADGVFMWAERVFSILSEDFKRGRVLSIEKRLGEFPKELGPLFKDTLLQGNGNMDELLLCFQWILYAKRPLTGKEFYVAICWGLSPEELGSYDFNQIALTDIERFVTSVSKGLAELTKSEPRTVQFIHESVRDFLMREDGFRQVWPEIDDEFECSSHDKLKQCCYNYMMLVLNTKPEATRRHVALQVVPFLDYASQNVFYHADVAAEKIPQDNFINQFERIRWVHLSNAVLADDNRYTPNASLLYILSDKGASNLVRQRRAIDPPINSRGERYISPLLAAVVGQHELVVRALLEQSDDDNGFVAHLAFIDIEDSHGWTPLCWAASEGHLAIVKLLVEYGANFNPSNNVIDRGPLSLAIKRNRHDVVKLLLRKGVDVSDKTLYEMVLSWAVGEDHESMIESIIKMGMNHNSGSLIDTPLLVKAIEANRPAVVELLINHGTDIEHTTSIKGAPLVQAIYRHSTAIVELLIKKGANVNVGSFQRRKDAIVKPTVAPLMVAIEENDKAIAQMLLKAGADVISADAYGQTPLSKAVMNRNQDLVDLLIREGSDVNYVNKQGQTALSLAIKDGEANDRYRREGRLRYRLNARSQTSKGDGISIYIVRLLLEAGADANFIDREGQTPLSWATRVRNHDVVRLLREHGASANANPAVADND